MICSFHSKFPTQNPPRPTQKNPFHVQIKYDTTCNFTFCRRLADEGDSKSLVLITRVGSTPTTGIKKRTSPACLGEFPFLSAACERVEQHGPALQGERSALRAVAQCAGDPHHRLPQLVWGRFLFYLRRVSGSNSTALTKNAPET